MQDNPATNGSTGRSKRLGGRIHGNSAEFRKDVPRVNWMYAEIIFIFRFSGKKKESQEEGRTAKKKKMISRTSTAAYKQNNYDVIDFLGSLQIVREAKYFTSNEVMRNEQ